MAKLFWREEVFRKDIDMLKRQIRSRLDGFRKRYSVWQNREFFYRGVVCDFLPKTISRIKQPPPSLVTKQGRLNRVAQSMFYASCGAPAVYYEIHSKVGNHIVVSTWELREPAFLHNLGFHPKSMRRIGGDRPGRVESFADPVPNETKRNAKLREQLSEAFTEDVSKDQEWRYKLPIAINEVLFDNAGPLPTDVVDGPRLDRVIGTVYPAMRMKGVADNVAIWPEYVERFLKLNHVHYVLVEKADPDKMSYSVLSVAQSSEFDGDKIIWRPGIEDERLKRGHISFEDGKWISRNGLGEIFEVH